jgi:preprotein translocase subunit SecA
MRHFDVQIIGAMALNDGYFTEMKTGEGKTLVATLAAYLNALAGKGVHVVTVNDYLAKRDAEWMGPFYRFLGLTVGIILEDMGDTDTIEYRNRRAAYACDITYGTNHEIAFDYLRDNLAEDPEEIVHRGFHYAIVDEVDFLLIDEARTPLIISGPAYKGNTLFKKVDRIVRRLIKGKHYEVDRKTHSVSMTDTGFDVMEKGLGIKGLTNPEHIPYFHAVHNSVHAHGLYKRDVDYIVQNGNIVIVDEFTGRVSEDKRFSHGLHQALEVKEGVKLRSEDQTLAKITYQTFFSRYTKLSGMSGTVVPEKDEFKQVFGRDVHVVPTNRPTIREDYQDEVFDTSSEKHQAIVQEILDKRSQGRPVLVGTSSVKESEQLSKLLKRAGVPHSVLNARNHRKEAQIIAQAGRKGAVTISTNMAGRGTDIILGGNPDMNSMGGGKQNPKEPKIKHEQERESIIAAGGLHVIGTTRHESVRIDNQLRGRAGRQGDPGSSQFFVSLDDDIWKKFGKLVIKNIRIGLRSQPRQNGQPISSRKIILALRRLQRTVERDNQSIRMDVLKYDRVIHVQREAIYNWRRGLVTGEGYDFKDLISKTINDLVQKHPDRETLEQALQRHFHVPFDLGEDTDATDIAFNKVLSLLSHREKTMGRENLENAGCQILLEVIDPLWKEHLDQLEILEDEIGYEAYAEIDPVVAWSKRAAQMWESLVQQIRSRAVTLWFQIEGFE